MAERARALAPTLEIARAIGRAHVQRASAGVRLTKRALVELCARRE